MTKRSVRCTDHDNIDDIFSGRSRCRKAANGVDNAGCASPNGGVVVHKAPPPVYVRPPVHWRGPDYGSPPGHVTCDSCLYRAGLPVEMVRMLCTNPIEPRRHIRVNMICEVLNTAASRRGHHVVIDAVSAISRHEPDIPVNIIRRATPRDRHRPRRQCCVVRPHYIGRCRIC